MTTQTCSWLIEVPSGHPEPDFPSDMWKIVECGAPVEVLPDGWICNNGHEYIDYGSTRGRVVEQEEALIEYSKSYGITPGHD